MLRTLALLLALVLFATPVHAAKALTAACDPTWPPMEFLENGQIVGFDRDLAKAVAKAAGFEVTLNNVPWDSIFAALESEQADFIASCVTITERRKKKYLFSDPYYEVRQAVVVTDHSAINAPEDLRGKTVGIQIGTTAAEALRNLKLPITIRTYDYVPNMFDELTKGRLDAVVCDDPVGRYYAARKEGFEDLLKIAFLTGKAEPVGFAFRKEDTALVKRFNEALATLRANGTEQKIRRKWFGE